MNIFIYLHRVMFACMLIAAFFVGALHAGQRDIINSLPDNYLMNMTLSQLAEVRVGVN